MAQFKAMREQMAALEKATRLVLKSQKAERKQSKPKKDSSAPKGETPVQVSEWNTKVQETLVDMKTNGWQAHDTVKGTPIPASTVSTDGANVFSDSGRLPTYKDAMSLASFVKSGRSSVGTASPVQTAQVPLQQVPPLTMSMTAVDTLFSSLTGVSILPTASIVAVDVSASKAAKEAEKATAKAAKEKAASEAKAAKEAEKATAKAAKEEDKLAKAVAKAKKDEEKAQKLAAKAGISVATAVPTATAAPVAEAKTIVTEVEMGELTPWVFRGQTYIRTTMNECWVAGEDGSLGRWAGIYDPVLDKIDETAEEPQLEEVVA